MMPSDNLTPVMFTGLQSTTTATLGTLGAPPSPAASAPVLQFATGFADSVSNPGDR